MSAYVPIPFRPPNKFLWSACLAFNDGAGHTGIKNLAYFLDRKGSLQSMVMSIKWDTRTVKK